MSSHEPVRRTRRGFPWGRLVLVLSLGFNLLVVGLIGGIALNRARDMPGPPTPGELLSYGPYTNALTAEERRMLRRRLVGEAGLLRDIRREVQQDFVRLLEVLRDEPFDRAAAAEVLAGQQARVQKQIAVVGQTLLDFLDEMDAAERADFADRLEAALRRAPPRPPAGGDDRPAGAGRP